MRRLVGLIVVASILSGTLGCCAGPYRFWQNYIGWNDPVPDYYPPGPRPPDTIPPGPTTPAAILTPPTASGN